MPRRCRCWRDDGIDVVRAKPRVRLRGLTVTRVIVTPADRAIVADLTLPGLQCGKATVRTDDLLEILSLMRSEEMQIASLLKRAA